MRILVSDLLEPAALDRLRATGHEVIESPGLQGRALIEALDGCAALVIRGATRVTAEVLAGAEALRLVVRAGTGLDNVELAAARARGIELRNTPAANAVSVAELTLGLMLAFERHLVSAAHDLRAGRWEKSKYAGREIAGRTLGLVGFGRIGREVAGRARAFDMTVIASDPLVAAWPAGFEWVSRVSLEDLLAGSDMVSLHLPLGSGTRGLIGAPELALLKPDAVLINAARGGVVNEEALHDALVNGRLRGAILDVFATEPPGESPLLALPNVLATPHLGASTRDAQVRAGIEAADIVLAELARLAP
ncbi:MAG: hydroxyacid dehydrogenase [Candidatus Eisenbacteria bacterium]